MKGCRHDGTLLQDECECRDFTTLTPAQMAALNVLRERYTWVRGWTRSSQTQPIPRVNLQAAYALAALGLATKSSGYMRVDFQITPAGER